MIICRYEDWGTISYDKAHKRQLDVFNHHLQSKLLGKEVESKLVFCEHFSVITLGRNASQENVLVEAPELEYKGVDLHKTERGGDVTFHGPGQCVVYPLFDIDSMAMGIKDYIYALEEAIIITLANLKIIGHRKEGFTGVWLGENENERKIAAIGVKCSRGITMHGLALNINTDLRNFELIVPCGIGNGKVTSIKNELGITQNPNLIYRFVLQAFEQVFPIKLIELPR